uniref:C2H2-type domain-containing protein n=1 Tax=Bubo bubo TaxID=30461 RepID=A0A8C0E7U9_BUBBB
MSRNREYTRTNTPPISMVIHGLAPPSPCTFVHRRPGTGRNLGRKGGDTQEKGVKGAGSAVQGGSSVRWPSPLVLSSLFNLSGLGSSAGVGLGVSGPCSVVPDNTQGSKVPREPQKCSLTGTYGEELEESTTQPWRDGVKNTHAATSKPVARAKRGTSKCPECGKIFRWSNSMRRHQRNHTGERPYKCPDCGKTFKDFSSLISLHRIHKGERPYKCLQCGECFSHSSSLSTHRRTHTGEKPSSCSDCGEPFTQEQTLILHQRIHPGEIIAGLSVRSLEEYGTEQSLQRRLIVHLTCNRTLDRAMAKAILAQRGISELILYPQLRVPWF